MSAPYRIGDELGSGTMGVVYRADQVALNRPVALKLLRPEIQASAAVLKRFHREALGMSRVAHPNVVKILDSGELDGRPFLAMELIRGRTLASAVEAAGVEVRRRADELFAAILDGVAALHECGILHRDLKPGNVMVAEDGRAVVMDLGLVKDARNHATQLTEAGAVVGTPTYLAPELLTGAPWSAQSDVWALGCIYFFMQTGAAPFRGRALPELIHAIGTESTRALADRCVDLDPARRDVLAALLDRDLTRRPRDARHAAQLFRRAIAGMPSSPRRTRRGWRTKYAAALALALAGVAAAALALRPPPEPRPIAAAPRPEDRRRAVDAALARLDAPRLQAEIEAALDRRPRTALEAAAYVKSLRAAWTERIPRELAASGVRALVESAGEDEPVPAEHRAARYRAVAGVWSLAGQLEELGVSMDLDVWKLAPATCRPLPRLPPGRAETLGLRWARPEEKPPPLPPGDVLVTAVPRLLHLFSTDGGHPRHTDFDLLGAVPEYLVHTEPETVPLRPVAPGEELVVSAGFFKLNVNQTMAVTLNRTGQAPSAPLLFRGRTQRRDPEPYFQRVDPALVTGPARLTLAYQHHRSVAPRGDVHVGWVLFHYMSSR